MLPVVDDRVAANGSRALGAKVRLDMWGSEAEMGGVKGRNRGCCKINKDLGEKGSGLAPRLILAKKEIVNEVYHNDPRWGGSWPLKFKHTRLDRTAVLLTRNHVTTPSVGNAPAGSTTELLQTGALWGLKWRLKCVGSEAEMGGVRGRNRGVQGLKRELKRVPLGSDYSLKKGSTNTTVVLRGVGESLEVQPFWFKHTRLDRTAVLLTRNHVTTPSVGNAPAGSTTELLQTGALWGLKWRLKCVGSEAEMGGVRGGNRGVHGLKRELKRVPLGS
ncbi:hypothetical protein Tco_0205494 [Tanacetum coccineum]